MNDDWDSVSSTSPSGSAASPSTFALPSASALFRYWRILRVVLAVLSAALISVFGENALFLLLRIPVFTSWGASLLFFALLFYAAGVVAAAISGRKGFDAFIPVLVGCVAGLAIVYFFHLIFIIDRLIIGLLLLLGAVTYVVIRKIRAGRKKA